jgi:hypothetical protein
MSPSPPMSDYFLWQRFVFPFAALFYLTLSLNFLVFIILWVDFGEVLLFPAAIQVTKEAVWRTGP